MNAAATLADRLPLYLNLIRWDRPAGWLLLLWPTLTALWLAADGFPGWHLLAVFTAGTVLMRSAGCCINDVADREFDRHVKRTAGRPVTSGALSVRQALQFGALLAFLAFLLVLSTNPPTILLSMPALAVAVAYPYAKRVLAMPQAVLGVAFSFGIPMGFTAVLGGSTWSLQAIADAVPPAPGAGCWPICAGCWPTTPSTRWSTATTTCASASAPAPSPWAASTWPP
jgi:4-hydroxybenzoate polyprenyltransferase